MKTDVRVDGQSGHLQWQSNGEDCFFEIRWGGTPSDPATARVLDVEPGIYSVLLNGRSYEVKIVPGPDGWFVDLAGRHYSVELSDPREPRRQSHGLATEGRQNLRAAMPGKVVRVLAGVGDAVEAGRGLVVVEAMKMQNEVKAPRAGTVVLMNAKEGSTVAAGEVLAAIE